MLKICMDNVNISKLPNLIHKLLLCFLLFSLSDGGTMPTCDKVKLPVSFKRIMENYCMQSLVIWQFFVKL